MFEKCNLSRLGELRAEQGELLCFDEVRGLWGPNAAQLNVEQQEGAEFVDEGVAWSWEMLRQIGSTKLMSLSWFAVVGIVVYSRIVAWYNGQVGSVKEWLSTHEHSHWASQLSPLAARWDLGLLLFASVLIAIAATIFFLRCPDVVVQNSRHEWTVHRQRNDIEYQGASFDRPLSRRVCTWLYCFGGLYVLGYLVWHIGYALYLFSRWSGLMSGAN